MFSLSRHFPRTSALISSLCHVCLSLWWGFLYSSRLPLLCLRQLLPGSIFNLFPSPSIKSSLSAPGWRGSITTRLPVPTGKLEAKFCTLCAVKGRTCTLQKLWKSSGCMRKGNDFGQHEVFAPVHHQISSHAGLDTCPRDSQTHVFNTSPSAQSLGRPRRGTTPANQNHLGSC